MAHLRGNVVAYIALFFALGGAATAALRIPANSVGTAQLKQNSVTSAKVKNGTLTGADIKSSSLGLVPNATHAHTADIATNATNAANASHATSAGNATSADHATNADHAANSDQLGGAAASAFQARVSHSCSGSSAIQAIDASGGVTCASPASGGGGTITGVSAGTGLTGGGSSGNVTLSLSNPFQLPQNCSSGQVPKSSGSNSWSCQNDNNSGGTITGVAGGSDGAITGGGTSGNVTLDLGGTYSLPQGCSGGDIPQFVKTNLKATWRWDCEGQAKSCNPDQGISQITSTGSVVCGPAIDAIDWNTPNGGTNFYAGYDGLIVDVQCDQRTGRTLDFYSQDSGTGTLNWFYGTGSSAVASGTTLSGSSVQSFYFTNSIIDGQFIYADGHYVSTFKLHAYDGGNSGCQVQGTVETAAG